MVLLLLMSACSEEKVQFQSPAEIVDGDTIRIRDTTIRLFGIDAPELRQRCSDRAGKLYNCGKEAKLTLAKLIQEKELNCKLRTEDRYHRQVSVCFVDGLDVGEQMVAKGQAWAFTKYSRDYSDQEKTAKELKLGIWQANNIPAWKFRKNRWKIGTQIAPEGCPIKGNISKNGVRIYHTPWSPSYNRTSIDESKGERWFCNESEAISAGWRAPY